MDSDESHFNVSVGSDGQSHKTVSTNHNLFEEKGESKRYRTEVLSLINLTLPLGQTGSRGSILGPWTIKLHRLTADKKLRKVRWSPLNEIGQKNDSMFATIIRTALFYTILFRTEFFQYPDALKKLGWGCIFKEDSQQNHQAYVLSLLFLRYTQ